MYARVNFALDTYHALAAVKFNARLPMQAII